jgi:aryl-alcohol dehydrogenase-like predicted oxidoreductase
MRTRSLGWTGVQVSVIGYGPMSLSLHGRPSPAEQAAILDAVLAEGVTFLDTADTYCLGPDELHHNERLIASVVGDRPQIRIGTKGGTLRTATGWRLDSHPDRLYRAIVESHEALGGHKPIFLWQHHWPDPRHTIVEMLRPVQRAVEEGFVRYVGVGNYSLEQLRQACDLVPVAAVQNQYNLWRREAETSGIFDFCLERQLVYLPYRPLGGAELAARLGEIPTLARLAHERGVSPQRLLIAWHLAQSPCLLPIPGSKQLLHVRDCLAAADLQLEPHELQMINALRPEELPQLARAPSWTEHPPLSERDP